MFFLLILYSSVEANAVFDYLTGIVLDKIENSLHLVYGNDGIDEPGGTELALPHHAHQYFLSPLIVPSGVVSRGMRPAAAMGNDYAQTVVVPFPSQPKAF